MNRRTFLSRSGGALAALPALGLPANSTASQIPGVDFRYAPLSSQSAICFPDDPYKCVLGERGDLRYGHGRGMSLDCFPTVVSFTLAGMESDTVARQSLESPSVPIVHTWLERPETITHLTTFATNLGAEGRVDNVLIEVTPRTRHQVRSKAIVTLRTTSKFAARAVERATALHLEGAPEKILLVASLPGGRLRTNGAGHTLEFPEKPCSAAQPLRILVRLPQEGQAEAKLLGAMEAPDALLAATRDHWQHRWSPFGEGIEWQLPEPYQSFLLACARNIQQAREVRDGKLTFQVGPTVYRGLWVVDGNFLLESARYLGYGQEAQKGLETTWSLQDASGGVFAGASKNHFKDTAIAMFSLVRQAELAQDWSYFHASRDRLQAALRSIDDLRARARAEGGSSAAYGLLPRGMGDGGLGGMRHEFTNVVWTLAGLKALISAADQQKAAGLDAARPLYAELSSRFAAAAQVEMRHHPANGGFDYLPMLMKEDPQWSAADEWDRPRPQTGQWALSHAIYPGLVFDRNDPVVQGHIRLMQAATQEDVPAETGWLPHEGLWTYNAAFVAHVYLWAGLTDWARMCFHGFLNHASPLYCWREEQPLRGSTVAGYVGDMPHNWASAECVLYLRHLLALEDGGSLRLLAGIGDPELQPGQPFRVRHSPTRFGRISLNFEPMDGGRGWKLEFRREDGPTPTAVSLPLSAGTRCRLATVDGASFRTEGGTVTVDPAVRTWTAHFPRVTA